MGIETNRLRAEKERINKQNYARSVRGSFSHDMKQLHRGILNRSKNLFRRIGPIDRDDDTLLDRIFPYSTTNGHISGHGCSLYYQKDAIDVFLNGWYVRYDLWYAGKNYLISPEFSNGRMFVKVGSSESSDVIYESVSDFLHQFFS